MIRISILLPTRGRRLLAERFINSAQENAENPKCLEYLLYIDEDDSESMLINVPGANIIRIVGPRSSMGSCTMACLDRSSGEVIVLANDDVVIQTQKWDQTVLAYHDSVSDKIYMAYPNDLNKESKLAAFPILSRVVCDLLVEPFPVAYKGSFIDTHLMEIFSMLKNSGFTRINYFNGIVFEHLHFRLGKSVCDQTYKDRRRFDDDIAFLNMSTNRIHSSRRLVNAILGSGDLSNHIQGQKSGEINSKCGFFAYQKYVLNAYLFNWNLPLLFRLKKLFYFTLRNVASRLSFLH